MIASNFRFAGIICLLLALPVAAVHAQPAPAPNEETDPVVEDTAAKAPDVADTAGAEDTKPAALEEDIKTKTEKAIARDTVKKDPAAKTEASNKTLAKPQKAALGSIAMRQPTPRLDQISLWREDGDKAAPTDVWDGAQALDAQTILPALVMAKNVRIKQITLRIAMSGVYIPAGMTDMEYIHWRANVLMAQKHPELAARLMNAARLGRDSAPDAVRRTAYELAAGKTEAACVESMAIADNTKPFWQNMVALCAARLGDANANKVSPDDIIKSSGALLVSKSIADNQEILVKLQALLTAIGEDEDSKVAAQKNKGQLLLLSLGALRADKHGADTQQLTDDALARAGF